MPRYRAGYKRSSVTSSAGAVSENAVVFQSSGGHTHDGSNSSLIETDSYSVWDFQVNTVYSTTPRADRQNRHIEQFKNFISNHVNNNVLEPAGVVLGENVINATNIISNSITTDVIAANAITANEIAAATITTSELATDAIQSLNFSYSSGLYSNAGSFFNLADGSIRTPSMFLNSSGDLYLSNSVTIGATTANTIVDGAAAGANAVPTGGAANDVNNGNTTVTGTKITANSITTTQIATNAIQSTNYVAPGSGQVFSSAGTFLNLSGGNFISTGFSAYANGSVYISSSATIGSTSASTVVSGAASGANSVQIGGAASDINSSNTTVEGTKITANSITTSQIATNAIKSSNYNGPDAGEVFSDAGTFLDLSGGNFISRGFAAYSNGSVYISSTATIGSTTASTVVSGAAAGATSVQIGGAANDVNNGSTTIGGTKITANSITTSQIATDAIKSGNYDGPDSGEVFSDAGTFLDLSDGNFISTGFSAYSNGSVYISSSATIGSTTASTVVSGAAAGATSVQIGGAASDVNSGTTNISGGKVRTGDIESTGFVRGSGTYSTTGARFDLDTGDIIAPKFRLYSNGVIYATEVNLSGTINASGGTFSGDITANGTITGGTISGATITGSSLTTSGTSYITASGSTLTITNGDTAGFGSEIYMSGYLGYGGRIRSNNVLELRSDYSTDSWIRVGNASAETVIGYSSSSPIATFTSTLIAFAKATNINASATINGDLDVNGIIYGDATNSAAKIYHRNGGYVTFDVNGSNQLVVRNNDSTVVKTFVINHPVDSDKYLVHAAAEGPTADVFYRGESKIRNGECVVKLPDYFESLTEIDNRTVTLTPIYNGTKTGTLSVSRVVNGKFTVYSTDQIEDGQEFYWRVDAVRRGTAFDVEPDVGSKKLMGDGPYTYLV